MNEKSEMRALEFEMQELLQTQHEILSMSERSLVIEDLFEY
jgi:hypothetical protein